MAAQTGLYNRRALSLWERLATGPLRGLSGLRCWFEVDRRRRAVVFVSESHGLLCGSVTRLLITAGVTVCICLGAAAESPAQSPRILAYPCGLSAKCDQRPLYKPTLFTPGSHYTFHKARWTEWTRFGAAARVTLASLFQGKRQTTRTTVVFSDPRRRCGVWTFTKWRSGSGDGGVLTRVGNYCFFVIA